MKHQATWPYWSGSCGSRHTGRHISTGNSPIVPCDQSTKTSLHAVAFGRTICFMLPLLMRSDEDPYKTTQNLALTVLWVKFYVLRLCYSLKTTLHWPLLLLASPRSSSLLRSAMDRANMEPAQDDTMLSSSTLIQPKHRRNAPLPDSVDQCSNSYNPVARIMTTALPESAQITNTALQCMQESVSEFISFITSEGGLDLASFC